MQAASSFGRGVAWGGGETGTTRGLGMRPGHLWEAGSALQGRKGSPGCSTSSATLLSSHHAGEMLPSALRSSAGARPCTVRARGGSGDSWAGTCSCGEWNVTIRSLQRMAAGTAGRSAEQRRQGKSGPRCLAYTSMYTAARSGSLTPRMKILQLVVQQGGHGHAHHLRPQPQQGGRLPELPQRGSQQPRLALHQCLHLLAALGEGDAEPEESRLWQPVRPANVRGSGCAGTTGRATADSTPPRPTPTRASHQNCRTCSAGRLSRSQASAARTIPG